MMHNVSRLGSRQGFTRQILIDEGIKAFPQSRFCHSREETSMNRSRFQQGICYSLRKFRRLCLDNRSLFLNASGVLRHAVRTGQRWLCSGKARGRRAGFRRGRAWPEMSTRFRPSGTARAPGSMQGMGGSRAMNQQTNNKMNSNNQFCRGSGFLCGTGAAQYEREFLNPLTPTLR